MSKLSKFLKRQAAALIFATSSVEKTSINQKSDELDEDSNQEQSHKGGLLSDALMKGIVTQEVKNLRYRMYKILEESDKYYSKVSGYETDGTPIVRTMIKTEEDSKTKLKNIKLDPFDEYPLEMIINNSPITIDTLNGVNEVNYVNDIKNILNNENDPEEIKTTTIGTLSFDGYISGIKPETPIKIYRELRSKFEIESHTTKLHVREITTDKKLLEFYVPQYAFDKINKLFVAEIKRAIHNPRGSKMLEINEVGFITNKTIGVKDFLEYQYNITSFDKIVEYNGSYVIKFFADVIVNGENILEKYKENELEEKYINKEKKKQ